MTDVSAVRYRVEDGIAHLVLDDPEHSANTMNPAWLSGMVAAVDQLTADIERDAATVRGVVISSAKKTFFAGGDLAAMVKAGPTGGAALFAEVEGIKAVLRRLELIGRPVVAAIGGAALGGGFEIALAAHHRIAVSGRYDLGLPEVTLGLLPGGGGITRTVRMFGLQEALTGVLLEGRRFDPHSALAKGLIDQIVRTADELMPAAIAWIEANPGAGSQPWDRAGYRMPGGTPASPALAAMLPAFPATLRAKLKGARMLAPRAILAAAVEGAQVDVDTASRIESRYFVSLATGQQFRNMAQAFFFDMQAIGKGASRPAGVPTRRVQRLAVLGAGMMGAGIAYTAARVGIDVVLKDVSLEAAVRGVAYSADLLDAQVAKGRLTSEGRDEVLARITPTADLADLAECDAVVEAVFESIELKHRVLAEAEASVRPDALLGTNTSSLPITLLAAGVERAADVVGIHFFSPVDRMPLIEIIVGEETSDEALARAFDLAMQLRKTPIVVNDSRGFFTSRVFGALVMEATRMVGEGNDPVTIERAASLAGFPGRPLAMLDELSLTPPNRTGTEVPLADIEDRLTFAMSLETVRVWEEGVLRTVADANIGSILGIGFPPQWGGALQHIDGYEAADGSLGIAAFVRRLDELATRYGSHLAPTERLRAKAARGETYR